MMQRKMMMWAAGALLGPALAAPPAMAQALVGGVPSEAYGPLHAWYDVNQSVGIWENNVGIYNDEILVDVRDTATGSGTSRGTSYGTNVETWAQFGGTWPRTGGFTGTLNGMTTWEVRNAAGIGTNAFNTGNGAWEDEDGSVGLGGGGNGYTVILLMNIHDTTSYDGVWDGQPNGPGEDVPILNGSYDDFRLGPTDGPLPGRAQLWVDAGRNGQDGPVWVMDAGVEMVAGGVTLDQWQVHTFVYNGENSAHYIDGAMVASGNAGTQPMSRLDWWSTNDGWYRAASLDFAEGLFYDEVLSDADRSGVEDYLLGKWGLSTTPLLGDTDGDGDIDDFDLINAIVAYTGSLAPGVGGKTAADGDTDGDADVDDFDLINMIVGYTGSVSAPTVPEPASLALLALGVAGLTTSRRARRD